MVVAVLSISILKQENCSRRRPYTVNIKLGDKIDQDLEKDSRGLQVILESNTALLHFFSLLNDPIFSPCPSL